MLPLVNHSHHSAAVKTVYVVEPDDSERQRLQSVLAPTFRNIRTFDNAESFLAQRGSIQQDCLITSAVLPGMSVLELIGWLKNEGMPIPVIVLGEDTEMPLTVNIMRAGAADFIERPFTGRRLRQAVRTAMR